MKGGMDNIFQLEVVFNMTYIKNLRPIQALKKINKSYQNIK